MEAHKFILALSVDTKVETPAPLARKQKCPSVMRRNARRRKTFLASKENDTPTEETTNDVVGVAEVVEDYKSLPSLLTSSHSHHTSTTLPLQVIEEWQVLNLTACNTRSRIMKSTRKGNVVWSKLSRCDPDVWGSRKVLSSHVCSKNIQLILQVNPEEQQAFTTSYFTKTQKATLQSSSVSDGC